jgi:hypothetical protein
LLIPFRLGLGRRNRHTPPRNVLGSFRSKVIYRQAFIRNCFILLIRGYAGLKPHALRAAEETHITGEIIRSIREVLEAEDAEPWMQDFEIYDDPPQNVTGRFGKHRPRIDIEFVRALRGRRPRFHIEAKRLYRPRSIQEYFGDDGLGMFVAGIYAAGEFSAGMVGYVQTENSQAWLGRLTRGFVSRTRQLRVCEPFRDSPDCQDIATMQISGHDRKTLGRIDIYHLLLEFL